MKQIVVHGVGDYGNIRAAETRAQLRRGKLRDRGKAHARIGIDAPLQRDDEPVVEIAMNRPWPTPEGHAPQTQLVARQTVEFAKNDVHDNRVRVETIDAGRKHKVRGETAESAIAPAPQSIRKEPPKIGKEMRAGQTGHSMPSDAGKIQVFDAITVDMEIELIRKAGNAFDHGAFRAVALVEKRREQRDAGPSHDARDRERRRRSAACPARAGAAFTCYR